MKCVAAMMVGLGGLARAAVGRSSSRDVELRGKISDGPCNADEAWGRTHAPIESDKATGIVVVLKPGYARGAE